MGAADGCVRLRAAALWCAVTVAMGGFALAAIPALDPRASGFTGLLVAGSAAGTLVAAGWLWVVTTDVAVRLLRGRSPVVRRAGAVRLLVLAACGAVVIGASATPAGADDRRPSVPASLSGLPLPDRATGAPAPRSVPAPAPSTSVRVRPGDSLWAIAEERLGPRATVVEVAAYWQRIHARNRSAIGPDPDLILPGQLLELPPVD